MPSGYGRVYWTRGRPVGQAWSVGGGPGSSGPGCWAARLATAMRSRHRKAGSTGDGVLRLTGLAASVGRDLAEAADPGERGPGECHGGVCPRQAASADERTRETLKEEF